MPDPSAGEIGGIFAGIVATLATIGGGIRWIVGWKERGEETRAAKLAAWEKRLEERDDAYQAGIENKLNALTKWASAVHRELSALRAAYPPVASALRRVDKDNPALALADKLLGTAYPLDPTLPSELIDLLRQIEPGARH